MKYRIIKETKNDGVIRFYPQKRVLFFFWKYYKDYTAGLNAMLILGFEFPGLDERVYKNSITEAKIYINSDHFSKYKKNRRSTIFYNDRIIDQCQTLSGNN